MNNLKKAIAVLLTVSTVAAATVTASASDFLKGDVDKDGSVDAFDSLIVLRASVGLVDLDEEARILADYDEDGSITPKDSLILLRHSVGIYDDLEKEVSLYVDPDMVEPDTAAPMVSTVEYPEEETHTQVYEMKGWSSEEVVNKVGPLFTEDQRKTGILASVSMAQFIVESGYGQSRLSLEANNCFGIKGYPGSGTWYGSTWDGVSVYNINTNEQEPDGTTYVVYDSFRMYDCMEDSIADHSAYLSTSMNGDRLRYEGVVGCKDYRTACQIIKDGGYATAVNYVDVLCSVIEYWDLTQYDLRDDGTASTDYIVPEKSASNEKILYRVRTSWDDWKSQVGAYYQLENARECVEEHHGYNIYDEDGNIVY